MVRLLATMGTSPGSVYETLLNLCRGSYECGGETCPRISIDTVTMIRTSNPRVVAASRLARLLITCSQTIFPEGDPRRLPCRVSNVGLVDAGVDDIDSRSSYERFSEVVRRNIGEGDIVDVTGGRVSMAVAAALTPLRFRMRDILVVASSIPQEAYQETSRIVEEFMARYSLDAIEERVYGEAGCSALSGFEGLTSLLQRIVTGQARTVVLYP